MTLSSSALKLGVLRTRHTGEGTQVIFLVMCKIHVMFNLANNAVGLIMSEPGQELSTYDSP